MERRLTVEMVGSLLGESIPSAASFVVEVSEAANDTMAVSGTELITIVEAVPVAGLYSGSAKLWWDETQTGLFEAQVRVPGATPVLVRVRASNVNGAGPWSRWSRPVAEVCGEGSFLDYRGGITSTSCRLCPEGAVCAGLGHLNVTARAGFWRVPWAPLGFIRCGFADACVGADRPVVIPRPNRSLGVGELVERREAVVGAFLSPEVMERCAAGHHGVACASCSSGWFPAGTGACAACGNAAATTVRVAGAGVAILVVVTAFLLRAIAGEAHELPRAAGLPGSAPSASRPRLQLACEAEGEAATPRPAAKLASPRANAAPARRARPRKLLSPTLLMKIVFTHLQTVSIVAGVQLEWPDAVRDAFTVADAGSGLSTESLALSCVMGPLGAIGRFGLVIGAAAGLALYALALWAVIEIACARGPSAAATPKPIGSVSQRRGVIINNWWSRAAPSLLVLAFILHASVSKSALQLLACTRVGPSDALPVSGSDSAEAALLWQSRLVAELDVRCDDPPIAVARLGLALPVLVFFSLGLPLGAAAALWYRRDRLRSDPKVKRTWGFLYRGFRVEAGAAWWESIVMLRKLLLAFVTVILAPSGPVVQAVGALLVVMAALGLHAWVKPYESHSLNALEAGSLSVACVTLCSALLLDAGASGGPAAAAGDTATRTGLSVVILASNALFLLAAVAIACTRARQMFHGPCGFCAAKVSQVRVRLNKARKRPAAGVSSRAMTRRLSDKHQAPGAANQEAGFVINPLAASRVDAKELSGHHAARPESKPTCDPTTADAKVLQTPGS